jgi:hypothetical protein
VNTTLFKFIDGGPYYSDDFSDLLDPSNKNQIRMYFKYNNADNPHTSVTLTPTSVFGGLYQIGGIITICGLINALLYSYNKKSIEAMLLREWKEKLKKRITMELKRVPAPKSSDAADLSQSMIEDPD